MERRPIIIVCGAVTSVILGLGFLSYRLNNNTVSASEIDNTGNKPPTTSPSNIDLSCSLPPDFPPNVRRWCDLIEKYSNLRNLNPDDVALMILMESSGLPNVTGEDGEASLMQLNPKYHSCASYDPEQNIACGTDYLRNLLDTYNGNTRMALAAYNAGIEGANRTNGKTGYVNKFVRLCKQYLPNKNCSY